MHESQIQTTTKLRICLLVLIGLLLALSMNCHYETGLFASGSNPPVFEIRRSSSDHVRIFPILIVSELHPENANVEPLREDDAKNRVLWKIVADGGNPSLSEKIDKIEYGKVPAGFIQETPTQGPPEKFRENQLYEARGPLSLLSNAVVRFKIVDGNVTHHPLP
jgi:hypothetical protein